MGEHDFTAFTPTQTEHVRFERVVLTPAGRSGGDVLEFWIEADAFMRHMNRVLVGTMLEVAGGRRELPAFTALLEGRPRSEAGGYRASTGSVLRLGPLLSTVSNAATTAGSKRVPDSSRRLATASASDIASLQARSDVMAA